MEQSSTCKHMPRMCIRELTYSIQTFLGYSPPIIVGKTPRETGSKCDKCQWRHCCGHSSGCFVGVEQHVKVFGSIEAQHAHHFWYQKSLLEFIWHFVWTSQFWSICQSQFLLCWFSELEKKKNYFIFGIFKVLETFGFFNICQWILCILKTLMKFPAWPRWLND